MTPLQIELAYNAGATIPELAMRSGRTISEVRQMLVGN